MKSEIMRYIETGQAQAKHLNDIVEIINSTGRKTNEKEVRNIINELRDEGHKIISDDCGYYIGTDEEYRAFITQYLKPAKSRFYVATKWINSAFTLDQTGGLTNV